MKNLVRKISALVLLLSFITVLSSCNRGLGCPNNFSLGDNVDVVQQFISHADVDVID